MNNKLPLSISIITFNEENRLPLVLDSIKDIASEIIVVDSNSTDKTIEIAESYGAKTYTQDWLGYAEQKNVALEKCTNDWVLCLDADEEISPELIESIKSAINDDNCYAYEINRRTHYLGKLLKYAWQPDKQLRLIKQSEAKAVWAGDFVHESLRTTTPTKMLAGEVVHYSYKNIADHFTKTIKYAELQAKSYHAKGKKFSLAKLLFSSQFSFIKLYFLKRGFLDGIPGLIAGFSAFVYTFLKYAFLWDMYRNDK